MQSKVFKPLVYSIKNGFRVNELTNQGSDLLSPVYKTALPSPSNTEIVRSWNKDRLIFTYRTSLLLCNDSHQIKWLEYPCQAAARSELAFAKGSAWGASEGAYRFACGPQGCRARNLVYADIARVEEEALSSRKSSIYCPRDQHVQNW